MNIAVIGGAGRFGRFFVRELQSRRLRYFSLDKYLGECYEDLRDAEWIFYAVPMRDLETAIEQTKSCISPKATILDFCSLKVLPCQILKDKLPEHEVIGTHPLFGPQSAPHGFSGEKIVLCNVSASDDTFLKVFLFFQETLEAKVIVCSPEYHDKQMALSQAMTHFIGRVAERMNLEKIPLSTKSFDDLMDIVKLVKGGSQELFEDMQRLNPYAESAIKDFIENSIELKKDLYEQICRES